MLRSNVKTKLDPFRNIVNLSDNLLSKSGFSLLKACVRYFLKIHYTSDLITYMKLQYQTMSTCVRTPRKSKLYVAMADASSTLTASG